ncbi:MAG TPA: hypothetical protein PL041_10680 [Melioribacteraceae bacterium]|nr:hypothetical protein [Melioribacteraceae bacterium]
MADFTKAQIDIEKKEYEILKKINIVIKSQIELFNSNLENSLKFIEYLTLPLVMASNKSKSYNPFAEIIERHFTHIINYQMLSSDFLITPLGNSSDLCFEGNDCIIHIDIKTANITNTSDFKNNIALGFNQISYPGNLPISIDTENSKFRFTDNILRTYPFLPTEYIIKNQKKLCLTYGLLILYPDYSDKIKKITKEYNNIVSLISSKIQKIILEHINSNTSKQSSGSIAQDKIDLFTKNAIRGYFMHHIDNFHYLKKNCGKLVYLRKVYPMLQTK